ncbi:MAG: type 4a pilus biogenesis protein PilO [Campylobacterales bacterium]|nr:type 4a pilus biogenesis protein PilO [Campylobacterales bacterium]
MKINVEDYLHKIDTAFKEKSQKDIYMTYIMVIAIVFAFAYLFFWDSSFDSFEKTRQNVERLTTQIENDERYLQNNPESVIANFDTEILQLNTQIAEKKDTNAYIKTKIEAISSLIYDERTWGEYLDSISQNAQKYNMKIDTFSNKYASTENAFGHVLDITISSSGSYQNTLRFINSLEQSDLVVDIHNMNITADKKLLSDLNISVWGITY